jgi:hypothetical protein
MTFVQGKKMNLINLHGLNLEEARLKLENGLLSALENHEWVVRIIHGQGKHSEVFPVVKSLVRRWLKESEFAVNHIETVYRGEDGSPYTAVNPGETIIVLKNKGNQLLESELAYDEQEEREARQHAKGMRADRLRKQRRKGPGR